MRAEECVQRSGHGLACSASTRLIWSGPGGNRDGAGRAETVTEEYPTERARRKNRRSGPGGNRDGAGRADGNRDGAGRADTVTWWFVKLNAFHVLLSSMMSRCCFSFRKRAK